MGGCSGGGLTEDMTESGRSDNTGPGSEMAGPSEKGASLGGALAMKVIPDLKFFSLKLTSLPALRTALGDSIT